MSFLKKISMFFSNELERTLYYLLDNDPDIFLNEENYYKFVEYLTDKNSKFPKTVALNSFFRSTQRQATWQGGLRHLMVMHKLIHDFGEECYQWISTDSMKSFHKFKNHESNLKTFVYKGMVTHYYSYLNKLSYNYEDFSICFHLDEQFPNKLLENNISPLHSLSKLQNILRYLIQIFSLFEASLVELTPSLLVKQITYFCFTDCYHYYTYINQIISSLIKEILTLPNQEAILLYELYSEHLIITRKIESYFQILKEKLTEFSLKIPQFFQFDSAYNTKIELYIGAIRGTRPKLMKAQTLPIHNTSLNNDDSFLSMKDVSKVIVDYLSKNNTTDMLYRKNIFEAPKNAKKKKSNSVRRVFPANQGNRAVLTLPTQMGSKLHLGDKSIEVQNTCIEASAQFESGQMALSSYPLAAGNQSFLPDENPNTLNASMGMQMNNSFQEGF